MRSQHRILVHVIRVCPASPRVIGWKSERIKVLMGTDYGKEGVVILVGRSEEFRLDYLAGYGDWVVWLKMKISAYGSCNAVWDVVPCICGPSSIVDSALIRGIFGVGAMRDGSRGGF